MRFLIYGLNMAPEPIGVGKYTGELAAWLCEQGHDVRVISAPPYYPDWRVGKGHTSTFWRREEMGGVSIYRCPLYVPYHPGGLRRVLHLASFALSSLPIALWQALTWRPNVMFVVEPTFLAAPVGLVAGALAGSKTWLHVQDFEIDAAFDLGLLKGGWLKRVVNFIETFLLRRFDRVSSISANMCKRLVGKGVPEDKAVLFPNWVDTDVIKPLSGASSFRKELGLSEENVVALYAGNVNEKQGIDVLAEVAVVMEKKSPNVRFVFAGGGGRWQAFQKQVEGLSNVLTLPLQPAKRLNDLLNLADIHLLPQRADTADLVMPSKLSGMLASGRPVIATASKCTQIAQIVSDCGIVVPAGDKDAMVDAVMLLLEDQALRKSLGKNARKKAEELWKKDSVLSEFMTAMKALVTNGASVQKR